MIIKLEHAKILHELIRVAAVRDAITSVIELEVADRIAHIRSEARSGRDKEINFLSGSIEGLESIIPALERAAAVYNPDRG